MTDAFRSNKGASFKLLALIGDSRWQLNVSNTLMLEYEEIILRMAPVLRYSQQEIEDILNFILANSNQRIIHYLWRPFLSDPDDDFFLELAVKCEADYIISYDKRDWSGCEKFGIKIATAKEFLKVIGEIK